MSPASRLRVPMVSGVLAIVACHGSLAFAQVPVPWPFPSVWLPPGDYTPRTAFGDYVRAQGEFERSRAQAAIDTEVARQKYLENKAQWQRYYLQRRRAGAAAREEYHAERREARERWRQNRAPRMEPLSSDQLDPHTGKLFWPEPLLAPEFAEERRAVEDSMVQRAYTGSTTQSDERLRDLSRRMQEQLKADIRRYSPNEYIEAKSFLQGLTAEAVASAG